MELRLSQIFEFPEHHLDELLRTNYNDNTNYRNLQEKRNAVIINAYNNNDLSILDTPIVATDAYNIEIWKSHSSTELKNNVRRLDREMKTHQLEEKRIQEEEKHIREEEKHIQEEESEEGVKEDEYIENVKNGNISEVKKYLDHGGDINAFLITHGSYTAHPLSIAAKFNIKMLDYLLSRKEKININMEKYVNLMLKLKNAEILDVLLKHNIIDLDEQIKKFDNLRKSNKYIPPLRREFDDIYQYLVEYRLSFIPDVKVAE